MGLETSLVPRRPAGAEREKAKLSLGRSVGFLDRDREGTLDVRIAGPRVLDVRIAPRCVLDVRAGTRQA